MFTFAYFTSAPDWIIIGGLIFILFGGQKIPEFARGLGEGLREFKKAMDPSHHEEPAKEPAVPEKPPIATEATVVAPAPAVAAQDSGQPVR